MTRGSGSSRRPRASAGAAREIAGPRPAEARAEEKTAVPQEAVVTEPSDRPGEAASQETEDSPAAPRFRIFIVDTGWDSPAHKVLQENFALIRELQREDPIYVLGRESAISRIIWSRRQEAA